MAAEDVRITFLGEAASAVRAAREVSTSLRTVDRDIAKTARGALAGSGAFRGLGRSVAFASAGFLGGFGLSAAIRGATSELSNSVRVSAQTAAALRSTGGAAGVTAGQVDALAQSLLRKTGADDEAIKSAENMLLTFTEVRNEAGRGNDIFTQATKAVLDMSAALGQDLRGSALQLGKALNNPITGMLALRRAGVQFTAQQAAQIKSLTEHNRILDAQKIILAEVNREFGGSAAAQERAKGGIDTLRESVRNLSAEFIRGLLPAFKGDIAAAQDWVDRMASSEQGQEAFRQNVLTVIDALKDMAQILQGAVKAVGGLGNAVKILIGLKLVSTLAGWATAIEKLVGAENAAGGLGGGASGTGLAGAAAQSSRLATNLRTLSRLGATAITVSVLYELLPAGGKNVVNQALQNTVQQGQYVDKNGNVVDAKSGRVVGKYNAATGTVSASQGAGAAPPSGSLAVTASGPGLQVPTSIRPTHQTAGLAGFPAVDIMVKPGTKVKAPEAGRLSRITGHDPAQGSSGAAGVLGYSFYYIGESGTTYYGTHLAAVAPEGNYQRGDVIAIVAFHPRGSHLHLGIHKGPVAAPEALLPSTQPATLTRGGGSGGTRPPRGDQRPPPSASTGGYTLPLRFRQDIAQAALTTGSADDKAAIRNAADYLKKIIAGGGLRGEKLLSARETLAQLFADLKSLNKTDRKASGYELSKQIQEELADAGILGTDAAEKKALKDAIAFIRRDLASGKLKTEARIEAKQLLGGLLDQLKGLNRPATAASLATRRSAQAAGTGILADIRQFLGIVEGAQPFPELDKAFGSDFKRYAQQINQFERQLRSKTISPAAVSTIRERMSEIESAVREGLDRMNDAAQKRAEIFTDQFDRAISNAFEQFDKETAAFRTPAEILLDQLTDAQTQRELQQRLGDAQKDLADALRGATEDSQSVLNRAREQLGRDVLAHALDIAQSAVLGGSPADMTEQILKDMQKALDPGLLVPDPDKVAQAQREVDDAQEAIRINDLQKQAANERAAYNEQRAELRAHLQESLAAWETFFRDLGVDAETAWNRLRDIFAAFGIILPPWPGGPGGGLPMPPSSSAGGQAQTVTVGGWTGLVDSRGIPLSSGFGGLPDDWLTNTSWLGMQSGGEFTVDKPTYVFGPGGRRIVMGEHGAERVTVTPAGRTRGGDGPQVVLVRLESDNPGFERFVRLKAIEVHDEISHAQGRSADTRRRSLRYG